MIDFLFSTRVGSMGYLGRVLLASIASGAAADFVRMQSAKHHMPSTGAIVMVTIAGLIAMGGVFYLVRFGVMARLRSARRSPWFTLLLLVPVINIIFLIVLFFLPVKVLGRKTW